MSDSSYYLVVDTESGICFSLEHAYVVDTRKIPADQLEDFNSGSDQAVVNAAINHGKKLKLSYILLHFIQN